MNALLFAENKSNYHQWPRVCLGEVAEHRLGKMLDQAKNTGVPRRYLRNPNIRWFDVDLSDLREIPVEEKDIHRYELRPGDVIVCEGGEAGRAALWTLEHSDIIFQKACHRVRVGPALDARYLIHCLQHDFHRGALEEYYTGATIKHLTGQDLARYEISLPPLDEQCRIVAILDKADALRRHRKRALDLLATLAQSIFLEMFGDPIENPRQLPVVPLESLVAGDRKITYGILKPGPDTVGGVPYVRVLDMLGGKIALSSLKRTTTAIASEYRRSTLKAGDLLMSIRGHVGRTAIVPIELAGANITQDTARIAISGANTDFVRAQIEMSSSVQWMARRTKGAAVKGINLADVRVFPVLLVSDKKQNEFARVISKVNVLITDATDQALKAQALFSSVQSRAFSGQL